MVTLVELGQATRQRRQDMGLTQAALARLSGLSRATVNQLEGGTLRNLSLVRTQAILDVLGLELTLKAAWRDSAASRPPNTQPLTLAARSASVSYKQDLMPEQLAQVVLSGALPEELTPHVNTLLEDSSVSLLAAIVEQLHQTAGLDRASIWANMRSIARQLDCRRDIWR